MVFVPMVAREGKIRIGNQEYTAILAQSGTVTGRFDGPLTRLFLTPTGSSGQRSSSWGPEALCTMREVDGQLYRISATASGDQLTVRPYRGEFGLLEVAAGQRQIEKLGAAGMLMSDDQALMILGKMPNPSMERWEKWRQNRLPVGDYWPIHLAADFGRVAVTLSQNSYSGGEVDDRQPKPPVYRIKIRKDTPFVLDFSGEPTVVFTGPGKGQTFKPGDTVKIEAVLTDAVLGMKINGLKDATRKMGDMKLTDHDGKEVTIPRYASLDPTVVITDSSRADVTSGKMPFG